MRHFRQTALMRFQSVNSLGKRKGLFSKELEAEARGARRRDSPVDADERVEGREAQAEGSRLDLRCGLLLLLLFLGGLAVRCGR